MLELRSWLLSEPSFMTMFEKWKDSGFIKKLMPTVDRIKNNEGYSFSNIQVLTYEDNLNKEVFIKKIMEQLRIVNLLFSLIKKVI
ncbi:hypothetical protein Phi19:3_gp123 [Cellulophaga phage phi19:3]|uniref:Uncharacterized protein n=1 Tax=Cellulophaga phage phi19:3 TaxID=1327971 RepID=R9ZZ48_9CAUD|nr:hypothetical protein Phi19:3_gp123 [Cellulophaga phage phi19:3]AGO47527.1 hypothetical protein Phi19:3_gp123 [Cellulophaga phage phi19:3]